MVRHDRLPRKLKKRLKNNGEWEEYVVKKSAWKEREKHIDVIFSNYKK